MSPPSASVSAIVRYPVKACAGHALKKASLDPYGIVGDRRWLVVDPHGRFLTQRNAPSLSRVTPELAGDGLTLSAPGMDRVAVQTDAGGPTRDVRVWNDRCKGIDQGDDVAAWLSEYLGSAYRLVRMGPDFRRPIKAAKATSVHDHVSYADGYPFLLTSEASLRELNRRMSASVPMDRFRPNLVISGTEPFEEDTWTLIQIGDVTFRVVKPCARCVVTTTDQTTGERGKEPLATLATFRGDSQGNVYFGQNLIHTPKRGEIAVGDALNILERGHPTVPFGSSSAR